MGRCVACPLQPPGSPFKPPVGLWAPAWASGQLGGPKEMPQADGGLRDRHLFSPSSGGWTPKIELFSGLALAETSFPGFPAVSTHSLSSACPRGRGERKRKKRREGQQESSAVPSYKDPSPTRFGPTLMTSANLHYLPRGPLYEYSHVKGLGSQR